MMRKKWNRPYNVSSETFRRGEFLKDLNVESEPICFLQVAANTLWQGKERIRPRLKAEKLWHGFPQLGNGHHVLLAQAWSNCRRFIWVMRWQGIETWANMSWAGWRKSMLRDLKYFPRGEVKEMAWLLQQDEELQGILSDALMRSEQHRENYLRYILQLDLRTSSLYSFTIIIISTAPPPHSTGNSGGPIWENT